jgi:RNA recognition motif-containing protein
MVNRAYVGNLPFTFTSADLEQLFGPFGAVKGAEIVMDRETGRSRGFGFVEMDSPESLKAAMAGLDGKPVNGRNLTVNEARERAPRPPGGGFRPSGDRPHGGGGGGGSFAPRTFSGPPRSSGGGDRPSFSGGGGGDRGAPRRGRNDRPERSDRLERPEKGRDDRWRYTRGKEDED